jgi:excisionase family DNA binding protein
MSERDLHRHFSADVVAAFEELIGERVADALAEREAENAVPPVLTIAEAAHYLRVSERLVQRLIADGRLRSTRLGRRVLLRRIDVDAFMESGGEEG